LAASQPRSFSIYDVGLASSQKKSSATTPFASVVAIFSTTLGASEKKEKVKKKRWKIEKMHG